LEPVRTVQEATHFKRSGDHFTPCSPGDPAANEMTWVDVPSEKLKEPIVTIKDCLAALRVARPSVSSEDLIKQEKFTREFGQDG